MLLSAASIYLHCLRISLIWLAGVGHEFSTGEIMYSCFSANLFQELEASHGFSRGLAITLKGVVH